MNQDPFSDLCYYLHRRHDKDCEVYTFYTESGVSRLVAEVRGVPENILFRRPQRTGLPLLVLKAWRYFPVNGKYDVLEYEGGPRLGILHRAGHIYDDAEKVLGRIMDPEPLREGVKEGLVEAVAEAVLSGGQTQGHGHAPEKLELLIGREVGGIFQRERLPFALPGRDEGFSTARFIKHFLPAKAEAAVEKFVEPQGWRLDFSMTAAGKIEPRVRVAAALFRIELERMSGG